MTKKLSLLIPGAIALVLSTTPFLPAFSQSTPAQRPKLEKMGAKLNLTEAQKTEIKQIHESTRTQIQAVLTDDQKALLKKAREQRQQQRQQGQQPQQGQPGQRWQNRGKTFAALNLTDEQKTKIKSIREDAKKQIDAVLTDEQRQQLNQQRQQMRQRRSIPSDSNGSPENQ